MRSGSNNSLSNECVSGGKRIRIKVNITKLLTMAHHLRHKRKRRCPLLMKMHCNNVASKVSPAQCLARSRSAISGAGSGENDLPYPQLPAEARRALDEGVICDMFEGHAPYKPRYVLPDYARFLANRSNGWSWKARKILMTHSLC